MGAEKPVTTPFGERTSAAEVLAGVDVSGRRVVVTGGASGIGLETARALIRAGAEVTLAVRHVAAGERAAAELVSAHPGGRLRVAQLELADLDSIASFATAWDGPLDVLINNAGVMALPERELVGPGWEHHFAVNHLGHFALAIALHSALASAGAARIVAVSSGAHRLSPVVFNDLHFATRPYDPWLAYGQSKTANVLFAVGAANRWARDGIVANALMPGVIVTPLQRHLPPDYMADFVEASLADPTKPQVKTIEQGAATSVLLAASPLVSGVSGRYFENCNEVPVVERAGSASGVAADALDRDNADRLWSVSADMVAQGRSRLSS